MLALRLVFSKVISDVPLLRISTQNYEGCKGCLIRRHLSLPTWFPQNLKKGHRSVISIPSVRWQTDGTSKNGVNDSKSKQEYRNTDTSTTEANDIDSTNLDKESISSTNDDDGKIVISFDYQAGVPLHHQLKKCMEDKTLTITHTKGKEIDIDDSKFSWPIKPKRKAKKLFKEDEKLIEEAHALADYLLLPRHLQGLRSVKKRNAYRNTDKKYVTMYSVSDLRQKTIEVWGSMERMQNIRIKHNYGYFQDNYLYEKPVDPNRNLKFQTLKSASGKVVLSAIAANVTNAAFKGFAWHNTNSDSMFAEMVHSLTDALNQIFILFGLYSSNKAPDSLHPYGYVSAKYLVSFIAGIGIFFFGGFINVQHGISGLLYNTQPYHYSVWAMGILITTTCTEGGSLMYAVHEAKKKMGATGTGIHGFKNFIQQGIDPSMTVVLLEDSVAVLGNLLALTCYYFGSNLGTSFYWVDSLGSLMIGGLLGAVGLVIMSTNYSAIIEKSVPPEVKEAIQNTMESDHIVRSVHDMKVVNNRVKAEIDFNGREITRQYLSEQDIKAILEELQFMSNEEEAKEFLVDLGDGVINQLGKGVDKLETRIKTRHPQVRHVDLESL